MDSTIVSGALIGMATGAISVCVLQPFDRVKTLMQDPNVLVNSNKNTTTTSFIRVASKCVNNHGVTGLWRGLTPSLIRVVPGVAMYFGTVEALQTCFAQRQSRQQQTSTQVGKHPTNLSLIDNLLIGGTARTIPGVFLMPITVLKARFESQTYSYKSLSSGLRHIFEQHGFRGLYSGFWATTLRDSCYAGLYLMFFRSLQRAAGEKYSNANEQHATSVRFGCALLAGVCASFITQPLDMLKTQAQLFPKSFGSLTNAVKLISQFQQYGVSGFFRGFVPRVLRRTAMTSLSWTLYEEVNVNVGHL